MSGSTIGGVVGGVVGFFFGAPQLGFVIGSAIGGAIDPEQIRGPSIGDAQRQTSQAGVPRPVVYGHPAPFMGNVIDGEAKARKVEQTESAKGGPEVTTEQFLLSSAIRICEGPIAGVLKITRNDQPVFDRTDDDDLPDWNADPSEVAAYVAALRAKTNAFNGKIAIYYGTEDQLPDPTLEAIHGVGNTPYYRGTAYMVVKDDDVTDMRGACAQWKFEVLGVATEGEPAEVTPDLAPEPFTGVSGAVTSPGTLDIVAIPTFSGATNVALVMFRGSNHFMDDQPFPYAPRAGLLPEDGYTPARVIVKDTGGGTWFDSGWMGDPVQQPDLNAELAVNGFPTGAIVANDQTAIVAVPTSIGALNVWVYRASFGVNFPNQTGSAGQIYLRYPDPALLPDVVTTTPEYPGALLGSDGQIYYPSWVAPDGVTTLSPGNVYLGPTVADIAERCNVPESRLDVSSLASDVLPGFLVAQQGSGADCIRPLQQGFFFDMPEFDGKLRAVVRGGATVADITDDDLLDVDVNEEQARPQEVEYPRAVSVVTQDPDANYAPVPQTSIRTSPDVKATNEVMLSLAIPFRADASKRISEKLQKVLWARAEGKIELPLPEKFSTLVPSDCITYANRRWLVEQTDYADGEIRVKASYDRASAYTSNAIGQPADPPTLPSAGLAGQTLFEFMNLPILTDLDDDVGFYAAFSGASDGWRGVTLQASVDGGVTWESLVTATARSTIGRIITALPAAPSDVIDNTNVVRVQVNGELSSITQEQLLNEVNACVIGDEVCQFQTATFVSEGVYDLSILTRGRLNSSASAHSAGTRFVLLNAPVFVRRPSSWIGQTILFRPVSVGTAAASNQTRSATWSTAVSQTEWPPVAFIGRRDTSNNITISWVGQGRLGSNKQASNSQHFDSYRVTITKGVASVTYSTVAQSFNYTAAQQTVDFGSATGTLSVSIAAINRITGASTALNGSIP